MKPDNLAFILGYGHKKVIEPLELAYEKEKLHPLSLNVISVVNIKLQDKPQYLAVQRKLGLLIK